MPQPTGAVKSLTIQTYQAMTLPEMGCNVIVVQGMTQSKGIDRTHPIFIRSLSEIPDKLEYREAVHWPDDGKLFLIAVESIFPADLLPILSTKSYLSPIRRLYLHGFYNPMASTITIISFVVSRVPYEGPGDEPQPFAPFASS